MAEYKQQTEPALPGTSKRCLTQFIRLTTNAQRAKLPKCLVIHGATGVGKSIGIEMYLWRNAVMQQVSAALKHAQLKILIMDDAGDLHHERLAELQVLIEQSNCFMLLISLPGSPAGSNMPFRAAAYVEDSSGAQSSKEGA